jgi:ribosome maturation factor RimP
MAAVLRERLVELVEPLLANLGYELVDLEFASGGGSGTLRIYIDRAAGVGIEDCERVSREVSALLDVRDPVPTAYRLEVSTPGLDRVLRTQAHYARFLGARIAVELASPHEGRRRYTGKLEVAGTEGIDLEVDGTRVPLNYAEIFRARLVPEWPDKSSKGRRR